MSTPYTFEATCLPQVPGSTATLVVQAPHAHPILESQSGICTTVSLHNLTYADLTVIRIAAAKGLAEMDRALGRRW